MFGEKACRTYHLLHTALASTNAPMNPVREYTEQVHGCIQKRICRNRCLPSPRSQRPCRIGAPGVGHASMAPFLTLGLRPSPSPLPSPPVSSAPLASLCSALRMFLYSPQTVLSLERMGRPRFRRVVARARWRALPVAQFARHEERKRGRGGRGGGGRGEEDEDERGRRRRRRK